MAARVTSQVNRSVNLKQCEEVAQLLGTSVMQISRWAKCLDDPDKFEEYFEKSCAKYSKILEFDTTAHVGHNSGENEWYTPPEIIEAARTVLGSIDLDPASTDAANTIVKAEQIYTLGDNALAQQWDGRVWMNPPYSQPLIQQFAEKLAASLQAATVPAAVVLVNNATETSWFRTLADVASAICFPTGRVRFWSPSKESATPLQGQAVLYAGPNTGRFSEAFRPFGFLTLVQR
jgi:ParB family chromosome partitioning protein